MQGTNRGLGMSSTITLSRLEREKPRTLTSSRRYTEYSSHTSPRLIIRPDIWFRLVAMQPVNQTRKRPPSNIIPKSAEYAEQKI